MDGSQQSALKVVPDHIHPILHSLPCTFPEGVGKENLSNNQEDF